MKTQKIFKPNSPLISLFILFYMLSVGDVAAKNYYVATNGKDTNSGSSSSPWATFNHAMDTLQPGDTLIIKNGTYNQSLKATKSGREGSPITIKAENDGGTIIDGNSNLIPLYIAGTEGNHKSYITIEGIRCQNSSGAVVAIARADYVTLKRVSAYNAKDGNNSNYHLISLYIATNILLEDCAASGVGRYLYNIYECQNITLRRCWGRWIDYERTPFGIMQIYGSDDSIFENNIGTQGPTTKLLDGIGMWAHTYNATADRNKIYGNIIYGGLKLWAYYSSSQQHRIEGNSFVNNVSIGNRNAFRNYGDANLIIENMNIIGAQITSLTNAESTYEPLDPDYEIKSDIRNSILLSGGIGFHVISTPKFVSFTNQYNNLYDLNNPYVNATKGTGEIIVNPNFNVSKYGIGAYLIKPSNLKGLGKNGADMGAEVLYRYQDGKRTSTPLWPWPMEERIFSETGVSVTWETNGGLWKTLDGVYSEDITPSDTIPPKPPSGLTIVQ